MNAMREKRMDEKQWYSLVGNYKDICREIFNVRAQTAESSLKIFHVGVEYFLNIRNYKYTQE